MQTTQTTHTQTPQTTQPQTPYSRRRRRADIATGREAFFTCLRLSGEDYYPDPNPCDALAHRDNNYDTTSLDNLLPAQAQG